MWQKARVIKGGKTMGFLVGREVWVEAEPPQERHCAVMNSYEEVDALTVKTNLDKDGYPVALRQGAMELLPEFADAVPIVSWQEWLEEEQC